MIKVTGYKEVDYVGLLDALTNSQEKIGKSDIQVAADIEVKTPATVRNAFAIEGQMVSDKVLTSIMKSLGLDGFVLWDNGARQYYISTKNHK